MDKNHLLNLLGDAREVYQLWQDLHTDDVQTIYDKSVTQSRSDKSIYLNSLEGATGLIARDTGETEVYAGKSRVFLNKDNASVLAHESVNLKSNRVTLEGSAIVINGKKLSEEHLTTRKSLIKPGAAFAEIQPLLLVCGAALEGQYNVEWGTLLETTSMYDKVDPVYNKYTWIKEVYDGLSR